MKLLLLLTILSTIALRSESLKASVSSNIALKCKLKVFPVLKKYNIVFRPYELKDETDILKLPRYYKIALGGNDFYFSGALTIDDECSSSNQRCRTVIYLRENLGEPTAAYANSSIKIGAMNSGAKLSCVKIAYNSSIVLTH